MELHIKCSFKTISSKETKCPNVAEPLWPKYQQPSSESKKTHWPTRKTSTRQNASSWANSNSQQKDFIRWTSSSARWNNAFDGISANTTARTPLVCRNKCMNSVSDSVIDESIIKVRVWLPLWYRGTFHGFLCGSAHNLETARRLIWVPGSIRSVWHRRALSNGRVGAQWMKIEQEELLRSPSFPWDPAWYP